MIGKTVRFTDHAGREKVGVVKDDKHDGRLVWSSSGRYLVVAENDLGTHTAYWVDEVHPVESEGR